MKSIIRYAPLLILLCLPPGTTAFAVEEGETAPLFTLPSVTNPQREVSLKDFRGKFVYVDFWASWCLPCLRSLPQVNALYEKYHERGLEVAAITIDDPIEDALEFLADLEVPLSYHVLADRTADVMYDYGVEGMPTSFLIGPDGIVRWVHKGFREGDADILEQVLLEHLDSAPN